jgi:hypothetical protein
MMQTSFIGSDGKKKSDYGRGGNDENFTPPEAVRPILQFVPKGKTVWCPFDTDKSEYVKLISTTNKVVYGHKDTGQDFYTYEPNQWDLCISNPPFSNKSQTFERLLSFNKPFCILMTFAWLRDSAVFNLAMKHGWNIQIVFFNDRVRYIDPITMVQKEKPSFSSVYLCKDFLPNGTVTIDLNKYKDYTVQQGSFFL